MPRNRIRHIFTYGTLMSFIDCPMGAAERAMMKAHSICLGVASIQGQVFDAGPCPGAVRGGRPRDRLFGELWQLPDESAELLAHLDRYEGCAPDSPRPYPYRREKIRVRDPNGRRVTAWMFVWNGSTRELNRIADGRWRPAIRVRQPQSAVTVAQGEPAM